MDCSGLTTVQFSTVVPAERTQWREREGTKVDAALPSAAEERIYDTQFRFVFQVPTPCLFELDPRASLLQYTVLIQYRLTSHHTFSHSQRTATSRRVFRPLPLAPGFSLTLERMIPRTGGDTDER